MLLVFFQIQNSFKKKKTKIFATMMEIDEDFEHLPVSIPTGTPTKSRGQFSFELSRDSFSFSSRKRKHENVLLDEDDIFVTGIGKIGRTNSNTTPTAILLQDMISNWSLKEEERNSFQNMSAVDLRFYYFLTDKFFPKKE